MEHAKENPTQHPNCVRSFVPIVSAKGSALVPSTKATRVHGPNLPNLPNVPDPNFDEHLHPRDSHGRFAHTHTVAPVAPGQRDALRTMKADVDGWDKEYGVTTKGTTIERFKTWMSIWAAVILATRQQLASNISDTLDKQLARISVSIAAVNEKIEKMEIGHAGPNDWYDIQDYARELGNLTIEHHELAAEWLDEAYVMLAESPRMISVINDGLLSLVAILKEVDQIDTKAALSMLRNTVDRVLPDGTPNPDFVEREHPRGPGGRFQDKPDAPELVKPKPRSARPSTWGC